MPAWAGVVGVGLVWGARTIRDDPSQLIGAPPFAGQWHRRELTTLLPAAAFALLCLAFGPPLFRRIHITLVPLLAGVTASVWATLLAASDGIRHLADPLTTRYEYLPLADTITSPGAFVDTFVRQLPGYPTHVRGHPPGAPLAFWLLQRLGLDGPDWAAALVLVSWGVAVAAAIVACRRTAGSEAARRAAPFVALAPAALWAGVSADALFAGVTAVGIAVLVVAANNEPHRPRWITIVLAGAGGVLIGVALHLSYGVAPLVVIPVAVLIMRRRLDLLAIAGLGALGVAGAFAVQGFWWLDGLEATRAEYWKGVARHRSWTYYLSAGNPAAFALATGPAWVLGLARLTRGRLQPWLPALAASGAVLVANLSGLSKGEVERIWLPYVPWVVLGAGSLSPGPARLRVLLGCQVLIGLVLQATLKSPW